MEIKEQKNVIKCQLMTNSLFSFPELITYLAIKLETSFEMLILVFCSNPQRIGVVQVSTWKWHSLNSA